MKLHHLSPAEVFAALRTGPGGLSAAEAARRLREFGPNRVEKARRRHLALDLLREFTHFFAILLWVAAGLAFCAEAWDPGQGMATLGWAVLAVIAINGLFSFWQTYRAERALTSLEKLLPHQARVTRDGQFLEVPTTELVPGDLLALEAGDLIPADCRLVEAFGLRVNNATVTGESLPRGRTAAPSPAEDALHSHNVALAGTTVVSGEGKAVVYATGTHTEFGRIASLTQVARTRPFPLQDELRRLSRIVAALAVALGLGFFLVGLAVGLPFWQNVLFAIGLIVANVPEGLLPTVTLALAMGAQRMARRNVLIRHLPAVETLGSVTVICTDKTGTLTLNAMTARRLHVGGVTLPVDGPGPLPELAARHPRLFEVLLLCQTLHAANHGGSVQLLGDPTEVALVELGRRGLPAAPDHPRVDEVPFDSDRRRLSTLHKTPSGLMLYTKGALEALLPLCRDEETTGEPRPLSEEARTGYRRAEVALAHQGLRVLALAYRAVAEPYARDGLERDLTLLGLVGLEDPPRPEVPAAVRTCREAGIRVVMVTGDHPETALGVARQVGLVTSDAPTVLTGEQLRRMPASQLQLALDAPEVLFARLSADQKMRIVATLQRKGEVVAVTGDGVNDAPALKQADIGIAMGRAGTDVARASADMVLADDNFASIVAAVEEGRAVFANVRKFLTYILTSNVPEVVPYLVFVLFRVPLPLTILQILAVDLGTDMVPALALGAERPEPDVMRRPPRPRSERLLTGALLARAYLFLGVLEAVAGLAAFFFVLAGAGWHWGQDVRPGDPLHLAYLRATTACLAAIVLTQVVNVFLCRSATRSAFAGNPFGNRLILLGVAVELLLLGWICCTPMGNAVFATAPLPWAVWGFLLPFPAGLLLLEEVRKWLARRTV